MKKLENYISHNREPLDFRSPEPGHLARFEEKLKAQKKLSRQPKMVTLPVWTLAVAAAIAILIAVGIGLNKNSTTPLAQEISQTDLTQQMYEENPELAEVETYYGSMVSRKLNELEAENLDQYQFATQLKQDLAQIEVSNDELRTIILNEGANEYVLNAMIENYKLKLSILKKLSKLIKKTKQKNQAPLGV